MNWQVIWLAVLTIALIAHMFKDATEFKKIKNLEEKIDEQEKNIQQPKSPADLAAPLLLSRVQTLEAKVAALERH